MINALSSYVYQAEYNTAWRQSLHSGFNLDPYGIKYAYSNPWIWNDFTIESPTGEDEAELSKEPRCLISADDFFANINKSCKLRSLPKFLRKPLSLSKIVLDDLLQSKIINYGRLCVTVVLFRIPY